MPAVAGQGSKYDRLWKNDAGHEQTSGCWPAARELDHGFTIRTLKIQLFLLYMPMSTAAERCHLPTQTGGTGFTLQGPARSGHGTVRNDRY